MVADFFLVSSDRTTTVRFMQGAGWGIAIERQHGLSFRQPLPIAIEYYADEQTLRQASAAYDEVQQSSDGSILARARVHVAGDAYVVVSDTWTMPAGELRLSRSVTIEGQAAGGFLTAIRLTIDQPLTWLDVDPFAPGMLYGREGRVNPRAIGSQENYAEGVRSVIFREDRLPAPMFGLYFADQSAITLLNPAPDAQTIAIEGEILEPLTRIDSRLRVGAFGCVEHDGALDVGYWFPGTEGEITYRGREFPFGQLRTWRRVYHPLEAGLTQTYQLAIQFGSAATFAEYCREAWRAAWQLYAPQVYAQDLEAVRRTSSQLLHDFTISAPNGMTGIYFWADASPNERGNNPYRFAHMTTMGFVGRGTDAGYYMLREAARPDTPEDQRRQLVARARATLDSYASIPMDPPQAEGFNLFDGAFYIHKFVEGGGNTIYLRSLCEGAKFMLKAWQVEANSGNQHERWHEWGMQIADFLLSNQFEDGGVPRIYVVGTGAVYKESPRSTYNAISLWTLVYQITNDARYLDAATRAGEFCWNDGHQRFNFVGGTIDNPDVIDKEAGTLSLEAYLALYEQTHYQKWLDRAQQAANYAETWIYIWDVPMPADAEDGQLHWKKGVSTVGLQLIATGHSLVDAYMSFDVASYAKLYAYTRDPHYHDVAMILLHNTKLMTCLPAHRFDLPQEGWQQEHWGIAPSRGMGMHRGWLPWVTCSNLQGILELEDFDADLYQRMSSEPEHTATAISK